MKDKYLAFVLNDSTRSALLMTEEPTFKQVICHHITIEYDNVTPEMSAAYIQLSDSRAFQVLTYRHVIGVGVECFGCTVNGQRIRPDGKLFHLTHSLARGHKAVESNDLMKHGFAEMLNASVLRLEGTFKLLDK